VVTLRLLAGFEAPAKVVACPVYVVDPRSGTWSPHVVKAVIAGELVAGAALLSAQKKKKGLNACVKTCPPG
jgi:hypothetical protein